MWSRKELEAFEKAKEWGFRETTPKEVLKEMLEAWCLYERIPLARYAFDAMYQGVRIETLPDEEVGRVLKEIIKEVREGNCNDCYWRDVTCTRHGGRTCLHYRHIDEPEIREGGPEMPDARNLRQNED